MHLLLKGIMLMLDYLVTMNSSHKQECIITRFNVVLKKLNNNDDDLHFQLCLQTLIGNSEGWLIPLIMKL